ncbi:3'(2'),5'-bisphosphate nucleotidase CysQ [Marinobacterium arenosum]|uniref:3'(2'),5'-bisphosphate nucleotidase CysQ n=1 Tax=Marinobacterium arenosum TaxID=2862496 RepID=UPI001C97FEB0|nr:3'(2'),5'-bisphosphate nucleotidase CysQ [Marinobacterium arenosum]MBY4679082.1 3'(2'),5'-bisphosphate nucleotidase CysQ [Marinobacterium arenosum]
MPIDNQQLEQLKQIARDAGQAIMQVYRREEFGVRSKEDDSPLTEADLAAHRVIEAGLAALTPEIPRLSEEAAAIPFEQRRNWQRFWCIDPLDGTKEFIRRNDEFTVNIALIEQGAPLLGLIYVPPTGTLYWGGRELGAWKQRDGQPPRAIHCRPLGEILTVIASRRHGEDRNATLLAGIADQFNGIDTTNIGSSLKMCLIAEGKADVYPRLFPTSEWDTAAAQAIVEAAGGRLVDAERLEPLRYNQRESLENPWFLVIGDPAFPLNQLDY